MDISNDKLSSIVYKIIPGYMNNDDTEEETETSGANDLRFIVSSTRQDNKGKIL